HFYQRAPLTIGMPPGTTPTDTTFVDAIYKVLFHNVPDTATLNTWLGQLAGGVSHLKLLQNIVAANKTLYYTTVVNDQYALYLAGATPQAADLSKWVKALMSGTPVQNLAASLLSGQSVGVGNVSFYTLNNSGTTLPDMDSQWVTN